jgi:drug/metabolite transporter (DMT)-like permease
MRTKKTWALFALVCGIFGTTFLAIRVGLEAGASPFLFAASRFILAGGLMTGTLLATRRLSARRALALAPRAALLSLFLTVGTFGCMFVAETRIDSGLMARLDAGGPLIAALFAALLLGKRLSSAHFLAFALGTAGTAMVASPAAAGDPVFLAVALGSVVTYAVGNVLYPRLFGPEDDPVAASALQALIGGGVLLGVALLFEAPSLPREAWLPLLWLALAGSVAAHTATLILVRDAGPVFASAWLYVAPGVATAAGAVFLGEPVTAGGIAGTALALAGVFVLDRAESASIESPPR